MINTVIFDFDGVIADSVSSIFNWFQHAASVFGIQLPIKSTHELKETFFEPFPEFYKYLGFDWENDLDRIYSEYTAYHTTHPAVLTDGIKQVINALSDTPGMKLAIVSSNIQSILERNLELHGLRGCFDLVRGVDKDDDTPLKPDPTILLEALDCLKSSLDESVYIGDQPSDVLTAFNASKKRADGPMQTISITTGFATREKLESVAPGADFVIDHPTEILEKLDLIKN
jgi:phosphoglycolate phosphatase-like HAD superfamily hydrolase